MKQGRQVRYSLTAQARFGAEIDDYDLLNSTLREIVLDAHNTRDEDSAFEFDFLRDVDTGRIDQAILKSYRELQPV